MTLDKREKTVAGGFFQAEWLLERAELQRKGFVHIHAYEGIGNSRCERAIASSEVELEFVIPHFEKSAFDTQTGTANGHAAVQFVG